MIRTSCRCGRPAGRCRCRRGGQGTSRRRGPVAMRMRLDFQRASRWGLAVSAVPTKPKWRSRDPTAAACRFAGASAAAGHAGLVDAAVLDQPTQNTWVPSSTKPRTCTWGKAPGSRGIARAVEGLGVGGVSGTSINEPVDGPSDACGGGRPRESWTWPAAGREAGQDDQGPPRQALAGFAEGGGRPGTAPPSQGHPSQR